MPFDDLFWIDGMCFFIRCTLFLPIIGTSHQLGFGVRVGQDTSGYKEYAATLRASPPRTTSGHLAHRLPNYPDMPMHGHWQPGGTCPLLEPMLDDHPLRRDWMNGIPVDRAIAFVRLALHPDR